LKFYPIESETTLRKLISLPRGHAKIYPAIEIILSTANASSMDANDPGY
jgi:hypothetical protein